MLHARKDYDHIQDPTGKVAEDEPVFLLRAKDITAPSIVRAWANELCKRGGDKVAYNAAMEQAARMEEWQTKNGAKLPDTPADMVK